MAFIATGVLGPVVFVAHWPYLWPDVLARYRWYISFYLYHEHFPVLYFGSCSRTRPSQSHSST
jgi:hypothetical protein